MVAWYGYDNPRKKEILLKYRSTVREIEWLEREIQKWRSNAERMTASYHAAPASGGSNRRSIEEAVEQIDKLIRRFMDYQSDLIRTRGMIENAIESLRDPVLQEVLQMRYLDGLSFHQIAGMDMFSKSPERKMSLLISSLMTRCDT